MATESALDKVYRQQRLWPQIHAAADVFLKRKAAKAEPYELTWRLIHLWESVVVTLAEVVTARLKTLDDRVDDVLAIREKCFGRTWNEGDSAVEKGIGALDGSIDRWIEILDYVANVDPGDSPFLRSLVAFLTSCPPDPVVPDSAQGSSLIDVTPVIEAWRRACDVPAGLKAEPVAVKMSLKVVNSFRNRFAHVPFPYDVIQAVFAGLEDCTLSLFSAQPSPLSEGGTLSGAIAYDGHMIKGTSVIKHAACPPDAGPHFLFGLQKNCAVETWSAAPFVHVDKMIRPYVLTRMKDDAGLWEFTRFLAESNAVITIKKPELFEEFSIPSEEDYVAHDAPDDTAARPETDGVPQTSGIYGPKLATEPDVQNIGDASTAIRQRRFRSAIQFLERLVKERPQYHVGWLKLGVAKRELAVETRLNPGVQQDAQQEVTLATTEELLRESLAALDKAMKHTQRSYRGEAHYQASKTNYRLWRLTRNSEFLKTAQKEAQEASDTFPESKYDSWMEYLLEAKESTVGAL